jgi:membrane-bound lytic murein transglycosylase A
MVIGWHKSTLSYQIRTDFLILILIIIPLLGLGGCSSQKGRTREIHFSPVSFNDLQNWHRDRQLFAFKAFLKSCDVILKKKHDAPISNATNIGGNASHWQYVCHAAIQSEIINHQEARRFFEEFFNVYKATDWQNNDQGRVTGYHELIINGSKTRSARYKYPIYRAPPNIKAIRGNGRFCHKSINNGALHNKKLEIAWVDSLARRFFLHIQGSGIIRFPDGSKINISYDNNNGHPYSSIGSALKRYGINNIYSPVQVMEWLDKHPKLGKKIMEENESYVFFKENFKKGAIGAQQVQLTPERSVAIDYKIYPYGSLFWLETSIPETLHNKRINNYNRLVVAQDTGAAINGPLRVDLFFGNGKVAEFAASGMSSPGKLYLLLPKSVALNKTYQMQNR